MGMAEDWIYENHDPRGELEHAADLVKGYDDNKPVLAAVRILWCFSHLLHGIKNLMVVLIRHRWPHLTGNEYRWLGREADAANHIVHWTLLTALCAVLSAFIISGVS